MQEGGRAENSALLEVINDSGKAFLIHTGDMAGGFIWFNKWS